MEKLSRVKKYEELRKSIETDNSIDNSLNTEIKSEHEETLKKFDSSVFKKVDIKNEEVYTPEREKIEESEQIPNQSVLNASFQNEYLDDFIKEVRDYNLKKGTRECENTQVDILNQLNSSNRAKRTHYVEALKDEPSVLQNTSSNQQIALEVQKLLAEEQEEDAQAVPTSYYAEDDGHTRQLDLSGMNSYARQEDREEIEEEPVVEEVMEQELETEAQPIPPQKEERFVRKILRPVEEKKMMYEDVMGMDDKTNKSGPQETVLHKKILEETQQLRVQMDEYEDELTDLTDGVEKTNKLLNFILCFLILVLLVIIGFIGYTLLNAGGAI